MPALLSVRVYIGRVRGVDMVGPNNLVSVIIPVYNGERFLAEAIESVVAQTYRPLEIILVDDGSTDGSQAIAKSYPDVHYTYQLNQGLAAALNLGVKLAGGSFLAFQDADDLWVGEKLSSQMSIMDQQPDLDIVFGHLQRLYSPVIGSRADTAAYLKDESLPGYFKGTALIRRESFWRVGLFDTSLKLGDFIDWFSRAKEEGLKVMMLPRVMLIRRVHGDNLTFRQKDDRSDYIRIMKAALDRRRQKESQDKPEAGLEDGSQDLL
jgi:glycosyltransferase involved in cell wall biosynthesis